MAKRKKNHDSPVTNHEALQARLDELTTDLQRNRADFENYRKRVELELERAREVGKRAAILKLLPVFDNIERAIAHLPKELAENAWAQSVSKLVKGLEKSLETLGVERIEARPGTPFNPHLHEAIQAEDGEGDEVITEELQAGYLLEGALVRPSLVKVASK